MSNKPLDEYILALNRDNAITFINDINKPCINLYCTRKTRHQLYKHLSGRDSPFVLSSYGDEDSLTNKKISIKKK